MRWSRFVHAFLNAGILWHAVKLEKFRTNYKIIKNFSHGLSISSDELGQETFAELVAKEFIVEDSKETEKCLSDILRTKENRRNIQALYLILTTKCNLKCSYCLYKSSGSGSLSGKGEHMNSNVAFEAVNLFSRETAKNNRTGSNYWEEVTFYGGEPLLNYSCLESSIKYIRKMQDEGKVWGDAGFVINTNGTFLPKQFIDIAVDNRVEIQISIDGQRHVHDSVRIFRSGKGSFDSVVSGMKKIKRAGAEFTPLITITNANIDLLPDFMEWLCSEFLIKRYGLNLLMHTGGEVDHNYGKRAAQAMKKTHKVAASFGAVDKMYEGIFNIFSSGNVSSESCGAGRKLVIFPSGSVHTCQALEESGITAIGQLPIFEPESANRIYWSARNRFSNSTCLACPAIGGCSGGCGASAYNSEGDIHGIDPNHCEWMKTVFSLWLEDLSR